MRLRLPRLTFLTRFTLVTFVSAAVAATLLALFLANLHVASLEHDQALDAVARVDTLMAPAINRVARDPASTSTDLGRAAREATAFSFVDRVRIYDQQLRAVYPADAAAPSARARDALTREGVVVEDVAGRRVAYAPLVSEDSKHIYVVAVQFSAEQFSVAAARERWIVLAATAVSIATIFLALVALAAAASRELERRRRESQATFVDTLGVMARTLDLRDPYTAGHSERVAIYTELIAREMRLPERDVEVVRSGALLHDLGKIAVPDAVLFKPAKLDADERRMIEVHPSVGASILRSIASMEDVVPCVLHHHEKVDGSGYPDGLIGETIPQGSRIIAVADAFDAMTTDRPYRRALTTAAALEELQRRRGTQFDDACVRAFEACVFRGDVIPPESREDARFARRLEMEPAPAG